jgi:hypothetical protein
VAIETLVHKLRHALFVERELELRRCICEEHELALHPYMNVARESEHHHDGHDLAVHHHDGRVVRGLVLRRCTCEERALALRLYMNVVPESEHRHDGHDLVAHHHDGRVVRG